MGLKELKDKTMEKFEIIDNKLNPSSKIPLFLYMRMEIPLSLDMERNRLGDGNLFMFEQ